MTINELKQLKESEDKVEFKEAKNQYAYNSGRKSILGYTVAIANEKGGYLILGVKDAYPHEVCGSKAFEGREGQLEQDVYRDLGIRITTEVILDGDKRVLTIKIPSRPVGKPLHFNDVPLMRVGDSLERMSDEIYLAIIQEQEPDFSATACVGLTMNDLDENAIQILKTKYSEKQRNEAFANQDNNQALVDLDLLVNDRLTYASLILLGKEEKIKEYLPQCAINLEYRESPASIQFDKRNQFVGPYFNVIDDLWKTIDARNKLKHIQVDSYIIDIPELNDEVIRESINNAVAHRDYTKASEIVIKHSKTEFSIYSHGGFPLGVTQENILTINSTPRNRLLADVMTKAGLVERSGQGVDKIFYQNLTEGKGFPSYNDSDLFQVTLKIPTIIGHPVFAIFVKNIQSSLSSNELLGVHDIITLANVRDSKDLSTGDRERIEKLKNVGAVKEVSEGIKLSEKYNELVRDLEGSDRNKIIELIRERNKVKMGEIVELFGNRLTRRQVNNLVYNMVNKGILNSSGKGTSTLYELVE